MSADQPATAARPWQYRAVGALVALYALVLLFIANWHHGIVATIAVAGVMEAKRVRPLT